VAFLPARAAPLDFLVLALHLDFAPASWLPFATELLRGLLQLLLAGLPLGRAVWDCFSTRRSAMVLRCC